MALPQLHQVTVHSDLTQAFQSADLVVFLDDWGQNKDTEQQLSQVVEQFDLYGRLIEDNAHKDLRVLVAGDVYGNLKCGLLIENAPSVDPRRFVVMATQLEGEARNQLAMKLSLKTHGLNQYGFICSIIRFIVKGALGKSSALMYGVQRREHFPPLSPPLASKHFHKVVHL